MNRIVRLLSGVLIIFALQNTRANETNCPPNSYFYNGMCHPQSSNGIACPAGQHVWYSQCCTPECILKCQFSPSCSCCSSNTAVTPSQPEPATNTSVYPTASQPCPNTPITPVYPTTSQPCPNAAITPVYPTTPQPCPNTAITPVYPTKPCPTECPPCPTTSPPCPTLSPPCPTTSPPCPITCPTCPTTSPPCPSTCPPCPTTSTPCPTTLTPCPAMSPPCPTTGSPCPTMSPPCPTPHPPCSTPFPACPTLHPPCYPPSPPPLQPPPSSPPCTPPLPPSPPCLQPPPPSPPCTPPPTSPPPVVELTTTPPRPIPPTAPPTWPTRPTRPTTTKRPITVTDTPSDPIINIICRKGTIRIRNECRLIYCPLGMVLDENDICIQIVCPAGTVWNGLKCDFPKHEQHNIVYNNTIYTNLDGSQADIVINNVNNLVVNASVDLSQHAEHTTVEAPTTTATVSDDNCCTVYSPRQCRQTFDSQWSCNSRSYKRCGNFCIAPTIYLRPPQIANYNNYMVMPTAAQMGCGQWGQCPNNWATRDCSGCAMGAMQFCSPYCYRYPCGQHDCQFYDQQDYCGQYPGEPGCMQDDGCVDSWCR